MFYLFPFFGLIDFDPNYISEFSKASAACLDAKYDINSLVDASQCPACYGVFSSCRDFKMERVSHGHVFFGTFRNQPAVAKTVKNRDEKCALLAKWIGGEHKCEDKRAYQELERTYKKGLELKFLETFGLCPSRRLHRQMSPNDFYTLVFDYSLFLSLRSSIFDLMNIFPGIISVCPQISVVQNMGKPLESFEKSSLVSRYRISFEALKLAETLSDTKSGFILYMTDTALDNLVWTSDGRVVPVDLDDIHVVDIREVKEPDGYYIHKHEACSNDCVRYAPSELCKYGSGDLNYYLMCKHVVNKLIFYDADEDLLDVLEKCVSDGKERKREQHVKKLKNELFYRLSHTGIPVELNFVTSEIKNGY